MDLEDDGYWHVGLLLTLHPQVGSPARLHLEFIFKEVEGGWRVKMAEEDDGRMLITGDDREATELYHWLWQSMADLYEGGAAAWSAQYEPKTRIGFIKER